MARSLGLRRRLRLIHLLSCLVLSQMDKVYIKAKGKEKAGKGKK